MPIKKEILELVANGKITKAIKIFVDYVKEYHEHLHENALDLMVKNKTNRSDKTLERISDEVFEQENKLLISQLLFLLDETRKEKALFIDLDSVLLPKKIFLSYHQTESQIADSIKDILNEHGAIDIIDIENTNGTFITELLSEKISQADLVMSIIATKPKESSWLAFDTFNHFLNKNTGKQFIGLYLDSEFLDWRFQMEATVRLNNEIKALDSKLKGGLELGEDFLYIDAEKKRLLSLKANFGTLLNSLKKAQLFDINGNSFKKNIPKILKTIKKE